MMNNSEDKTLEELLSAYAEGKRHFRDWDFEEDLSVRGIDLSGVRFEGCFLFLDFREVNLTNSEFISCNMKTADFRGANLTNARIKNCLVESAMFKGAKTENFIFEENYYFGFTLGMDDFEKTFKDTDAYDEDEQQ